MIDKFRFGDSYRISELCKLVNFFMFCTKMLITTVTGDLHHQHPDPLLGHLHLLRSNCQDFQVLKTETFTGGQLSFQALVKLKTN